MNRHISLLSGALGATVVMVTIFAAGVHQSGGMRNVGLYGAASTSSTPSPSAPAPSPSPSPTSTTSATPIVFVHGFVGGSACPGMDTVKFWGGLERFFAIIGHQPTAAMVSVRYYKCDSDGYDITGDSATHNNAFTSTSAAPYVAYTRRTRIETIAKNLAWFLYANYTRQHVAVNVVGHSMGGLIVREALQHVQAHDPAYPRSLTVQHAVTIASPFAGAYWYGCTATQCNEFAPGSAFLTALNTNASPQGSGGTSWTAIGARSCDFVSPRSATHIHATAIVYTSPCYSHTDYLTDLSVRNDAIASAAANGRHAIAEVWSALHS